MESSESCRLCGGPSYPILSLLPTRLKRTFLLCTVCDLAFVPRTELPSPELERARYEEHNNNPEDPRYQAFFEPLLSALARHLPSGAEGLDFGCGPGPAVQPWMEARGYSVQNYDPFFAPDPRALERSFDFIVSTEVVEHLHEPARTFQTLRERLRPGGWLAIKTGVRRAWERVPEWHYVRDPTHVCLYSRDTFLWIAERFDFEVEFPERDGALFRDNRTP